jgi:uncharacterized protein (TIGR00725 family)
MVATGGRAVGVMDAACRGARSADGIAIGILPDDDAQSASRAVDIAIVTGLGEMRDQVVVLSSDAVVVCGVSAGTSAEVALAIKAQKQVVLVRPDAEVHTFFEKLSRGRVRVALTAVEAMQIVLESGTADSSESEVPRSQ